MKSCINNIKLKQHYSFLLISILSVASMFIACGGGEDSPGIPDTPASGDDGALTMTVTPDTIFMGPEEGVSKTFKVTFNRASSFYAKSDKDWCVLSQAEGSGKTSYSVIPRVKENGEDKERVARISFYGGELTQYAYVLQKASSEKIQATVSPDTLFLDSHAGSSGVVNVTMSKKDSYSFSCSDKLKAELNAGSTSPNLSFTITATENNEGDDYVGWFSFTCAKTEYKTCIIQKGKVKEEVGQGDYNVTITPDTHDVEPEGGTCFSLVEIDRETGITVTSNEIWCIPEDAGFDNPSKQFKLYMKVYANTGKDSRTATITVKAGNSSKTCRITQKGGYTGKLAVGGTIAEAVDLGLSVKWAMHNLGASDELEAGAYMSWGELNEKQKYDDDNYKYYNPILTTYTDIGEEISGTSYDASAVHWYNGWRMPTSEECKELMEKCSWEWIRIDKVNGYKITGPNGNSIYLPAAGVKRGVNIVGANERCDYWSGSFNETNKSHAFSIYAIPAKAPTNYSAFRRDGRAIRPVKDK